MPAKVGQRRENPAERCADSHELAVHPDPVFAKQFCQHLGSVDSHKSPCAATPRTKSCAQHSSNAEEDHILNLHASATRQQ
jgi:hypothetical protein